MAKVVIFGMSQWAELAHFYLTHDSPHEVAAFTVDRDHITSSAYKGLPVVPYDEIEQHYPPREFKMFIPISFEKMNHPRAKKYDDAKLRGYGLISYVSSKAITFPDFECGDNCFILEGNTIQPFVKIGNDVVIWTKTHVGHHSVIKDHVFLGHVVVAGNCVVESFSFLGVNAVIRDAVVVARDTLVGPMTYIAKDTKEFEVYHNPGTEPARVRSDRIRNIGQRRI